MQVASRILLVWGVVNNFPFLAKSPGYSSMLVAWSVTEVIRYSYFTFTLSGYNPKPLTWLRYNTFSVLYPLGISSECWLIYKAIAPAKKIRQEFAWVLQLILVIYIPGMFVEYSRKYELIPDRLVHPVHTYDGPTKKGHEGFKSKEDGIDKWKRLKNSIGNITNPSKSFAVMFF